MIIRGQKIGEGGFSHVLRCTLFRNGEKINVAVKMVKESKLSYYLMELMILSSIQHPSIVKCLNIDRDENYVYIAEELAEYDLHSYIVQLQKDKYLRHDNRVLNIKPEGKMGLNTEFIKDYRMNLGSNRRCLGSNLGLSNTSSMNMERQNSQIQIPLNQGISNRMNTDIKCLSQIHNIFNNQDTPGDNTLKSWLHQILQGLAFLHCNNIIHLDIKPSNILLFKDGSVKITDFSYSRFGGNVEGSLGTNCYKSPEVLNGENIGEKSDIWSLGNTFYYLKYGQILIPGQFKDKKDRYLKSIESLCRTMFIHTESFRLNISKHKQVLNLGGNEFNPDKSMARMLSEPRNDEYQKMNRFHESIQESGNVRSSSKLSNGRLGINSMRNGKQLSNRPGSGNIYSTSKHTNTRRLYTGPRLHPNYIESVLNERFILSLKFMENIDESIESLIYHMIQFYPSDRPSALDLLNSRLFEGMTVKKGRIMFCNLDSNKLNPRMYENIVQCLTTHTEVNIDHTQRKAILDLVMNNSYRMISFKQ